MLLGMSEEHEVPRPFREAAVAADLCQDSPARELVEKNSVWKAGSGPIPMSFRGNKQVLIERELEPGRAPRSGRRGATRMLRDAHPAETTKLQLDASTAGLMP